MLNRIIRNTLVKIKQKHILHGVIEEITLNHIKGWAKVNPNKAQEAQIKFNKTTFLVPIRRSERPDVQQVLNEHASNHGFELDIPPKLKIELIQGGASLNSLNIKVQGYKLLKYQNISIEDISELTSYQYQPAITFDKKNNKAKDTHLTAIERFTLYGMSRYKNFDSSMIEVFVDNEKINCNILSNKQKKLSFFEIGLPGNIWKPHSKAVSLTVNYEGHPLCSSIELTNHHLSDWLFQATCFYQHDDYLCLLAIEHLKHNKDIVLTTKIKQSLNTLIEQYKLEHYVDLKNNFGAPYLTDSLDKQADLEKFKKDISSMLAKEHALEEALTYIESILTTLLDKRHRAFILITLSIYFCKEDCFDAYFEKFKSYYTDILKSGKTMGVWGQTAILAWCLKNQDFDSIELFLKNLSNTYEGWFNSEVVLWFTKNLLNGSNKGLIKNQKLAAKCILKYVNNLKTDYWSRLHDINLMHTLIAIYNFTSKHNSVKQSNIVTLIIQYYGLSVDFWKQLEKAGFDSCDHLIPIQRYHMKVLSANTKVDSSNQDYINAINFFVSHNNLDAITLKRHLIVNKGFCSSYFDKTLCVQEQLKLATHPAFNNKQTIDSKLVKDEIIKISGVPLNQNNHLSDSPSNTDCHAQLNSDNACLDIESNLLDCLNSQYDSDIKGILTLLEDYLDKNRSTYLNPAIQSALFRLYVSEKDNRQAKFLINKCESLFKKLDIQFLPPPLKQQRVLGSGEKPHSDVLVVIYSCNKYLDTRIPKIRETWVKDLIQRGIPYVVLVGDGNNSLSGDILSLNVPDTYEKLPQKSLALFNWVLKYTDFQYVLKIDDDCYLDVENYFDSQTYRKFDYYGRVIHRQKGSMNRTWHHEKSQSIDAKTALDKSPEPSSYCDGGGAYCLSRNALQQLKNQQQTTEGKRLIGVSFMEDKLVGDLLKQGNITPSNESYFTLVRRKTFQNAQPVNMWDNSFYPNKSTPTKIVHADTERTMHSIKQNRTSYELTPKKLWSPHLPMRLGFNSNQLELLSNNERALSLLTNDIFVISVVYNEILMLPHFLAHYRAMGIKCFIMVDNLSSDGSREYLLSQNDVVLYSADTEYRESHFGVDWQEAILANHCINKWVIIADADEFLVYPNDETQALSDFLNAIEKEGANSLMTAMIDMYPKGKLEDADLTKNSPFEVLNYYDQSPLVENTLFNGHFSNGKPFVSAMRHRLSPLANTSDFVSQKYAVLKYQPWMRFSEGIHFSVNNKIATSVVAFCHFKYHAAFKQKVEKEIVRKQHYNNADEYQKYLILINESKETLYCTKHSIQFKSSDHLLNNLVRY